jgi:hypothetical protein
MPAVLFECTSCTVAIPACMGSKVNGKSAPTALHVGAQGLDASHPPSTKPTSKVFPSNLPRYRRFAHARAVLFSSPSSPPAIFEPPTAEVRSRIRTLLGHWDHVLLPIISSVEANTRRRQRSVADCLDNRLNVKQDDIDCLAREHGAARRTFVSANELNTIRNLPQTLSNHARKTADSPYAR